MGARVVASSSEGYSIYVIGGLPPHDSVYCFVCSDDSAYVMLLPPHGIVYFRIFIPSDDVTRAFALCLGTGLGSMHRRPSRQLVFSDILRDKPQCHE